MNKAYFRQLNKFATNTEISRDEMRDMILDWYEQFTVYTRRLDGSRLIMDSFTFAGPSGRIYDYSAKGYMIVQTSQYKNGTGNGVGFRTIILDNVYRIDKGGKPYIVK